MRISTVLRLSSRLNKYEIETLALGDRKVPISSLSGSLGKNAGLMRISLAPTLGEVLDPPDSGSNSYTLNPKNCQIPLSISLIIFKWWKFANAPILENDATHSFPPSFDIFLLGETLASSQERERKVLESFLEIIGTRERQCIPC
jgi:hypothetical protein